MFEEYYNLNNQGFGTFYKMAPRRPEGEPFFGSASTKDARNLGYDGMDWLRIPFSPHRLERLTPFAPAFDAPARLSDPSNPESPRVGKVTHPSGRSRQSSADGLVAGTGQQQQRAQETGHRQRHLPDHAREMPSPSRGRCC